MNALLALIVRMCSLLLRLYPKTFRNEFEEQMLLDFSDMVVEARKKDVRALIYFCLHEFVDFPASLLRAHLKDPSITPAFPPRAAHNILRIAFAFGLALALDTFAGMIAFTDRVPFPAIWRVGHLLGWRGTYQDIQSVLLNVSEFILGPVLAAILLLVIFPEMRPIKRYLPALVLTFTLPSILNVLRSTAFKNLTLTFEDTIFALASYLLVGVGFGMIASLISGERKKILWLLAAGPLGLFFTRWVLNVLMLRFPHESSGTFWGAVASVAMRNVLVGMTVGLLLGVVVEFKKKNNSPTQLPSP